MMNTREAARLLRRNQTEAEQLLWSKLRGHQLSGLKVRRQRPIGTFIADFYCHEARLVVEVDGSVHQQRAQMAHDAERDTLFDSLGLRVLRLTNDEVLYRTDTALARILATARSQI